MLAGLLALVAGAAVAQEAVRTVLTRTDIGGTDREAVLGRADLPKGAVIARHIHPGEEIGVLKAGELTLTLDGSAPRRLKAGDTYVIPRGVPHEARGESVETATLIATWIIDKGQPLATPAP